VVEDLLVCLDRAWNLRPLELLVGDPQERARWLAARTGLDPTAIWEWGVVERVSTGLLGLQVDLQPVANQMLEVAERIAV